MLDIHTFDNPRGGNVAYKALAHPVAAERLGRLAASLNSLGPVSIYDPDGISALLLALQPAIAVQGVYVHDTLAIGEFRGGHAARPLTALMDTQAPAQTRAVLIAAFDAAVLAARIRRLVPEDTAVMTLDELRLPANLITNTARYLDALNFATNFAFFRDDGHFGTRLSTANYWSAYGARSVRFFFRLYDAFGAVLAQWEQDAPGNAGGFVLDSGEVRRRFGLPPFVGQLFIHAVGVARHDVVKYALDTYATDGGRSLSSTHDANAWPADRYAGLPAPAQGEQVILWVQNCHASSIPAGAMTLQRMGTEAPVAIQSEIGGFATYSIDVSDCFPGLRWPSQLEFRAGRHVVRPRYEVRRNERTRIAHMNVERADLLPDPAIKSLRPELGRGFILPFPILPRAAFRTLVLPTPMTVRTEHLPLRLDVFSADGAKTAERYLGLLPRAHAVVVDLDEVLNRDVLIDGGHAELAYDFREGGDADGWLHALFRYEHRSTGHAAESSFGAHMYNTIMTFGSEPQSYGGPPPGLSTKLFLRIGPAELETFFMLIYPASFNSRLNSNTTLELHGSTGALLASNKLEIPCCGSTTMYLSQQFEPDDLRGAGIGGYVLIRDPICRLFGFQGLEDRAGQFSFDHMFGF
jgi:hypothetical protein